MIPGVKSVEEDELKTRKELEKARAYIKSLVKEGGVSVQKLHLIHTVEAPEGYRAYPVITLNKLLNKFSSDGNITPREKNAIKEAFLGDIKEVKTIEGKYARSAAERYLSYIKDKIAAVCRTDPDN